MVSSGIGIRVMEQDVTGASASQTGLVEQRSEPCGLGHSATIPSAAIELLLTTIAEADAVASFCPAKRGWLGERLCPRCGAGSDEPCRPELQAEGAVNAAARMLAASAMSAGTAETPKVAQGDSPPARSANAETPDTHPTTAPAERNER